MPEMLAEPGKDQRSSPLGCRQRDGQSGVRFRDAAGSLSAASLQYAVFGFWILVGGTKLSRANQKPGTIIQPQFSVKLAELGSAVTHRNQKMSFTAKDVQELRQRTGAGMMECKRALEETNGNMEQAVENLRKKGIAKADKRVGKQTSEGQITSYIHHNGKVGVLVEVNCETDFVARTDDFKTLAREIALHIASAAPLSVDKDGVPSDAVDREKRIFEEQARESGKPENIIAKMVEGKVESYYKEVVLLSQPWVREPKKTIGDLVKEASARVGENIQVRRFVRFQMGEE